MPKSATNILSKKQFSLQITGLLDAGSVAKRLTWSRTVTHRLPGMKENCNSI
jgi:hypothetical protein